MPAETARAKLAPNQRWTPALGTRSKAREVVRLTITKGGYPGVTYAPFWPNCGHTETTTMREESFRSWIRKMRATCEVIEDEF
jgi:hypothetical protein